MNVPSTPQPIQQNPTFQAAIAWYNDAIARYNALPADLEDTDPVRYANEDAAYLAVSDALYAAIDAHVAVQAAKMLQQALTSQPAPTTEGK